MAVKPRPIGSEEHERVKDYLMMALKDLGVSPEVQTVEGIFSSWGDLIEGKVENIVARIKGKDSSHAIMITSHYDSVNSSPGAADAGSGVAAILETVRALMNSPALQNDIVILISDGEESGLLGAQAFVQFHPWAKDVDIVLNFEARGNQGPSVLFETSEGNGSLVTGFIVGAKSPVAHSLLYDLYKNTQHDTDLTIYKNTGIQGLNFAFFDGLFSYHTPEDTIENLSLRSLQHHGDYMFELVKHFGNNNLDKKYEENRLYFNVIGKHVVSYKKQYVLPIMIFAIIGFLLTYICGYRRKRINFTGTCLGLTVFILTTILSYYIGCGLLKGLSFNTGWDPWTMSSIPKISTSIFISAIIFTFALFMPIYQIVLKRINENNLTIGAFFVWLVLIIYSSIYYEMSSYIFVWPFVYGLIVLNLLIHRKKTKTLMAKALSICMLVFPFIFVVPIIYLLYTFFTLEYLPILITATALLIAYMIPAWNKIKGRYFIIAPLILFSIGLFILIGSLWFYV